jgi:hypothetical protein
MKGNYKSLLIGAALMSALALPAFSAQISCTLADYKGVYAYSSQGALITLPPQAAALVGPFAQAGIIISDGLGNLTLRTQASFNGFVLANNTTATYTVTPDCQIQFNVYLPTPLNLNSVFNGVFARGARQTALMITTPQGSVLPAQQFKQDLRFCGVGDVSGSYQLSLGGTIVAPKSIAGLYSEVGRLVADGQGNFTATSTADYNGGVVQEALQGTYSVDSDCIVTFNYTLNGQPFSIYGPLTGHGEQALLVVNTSGWAVTGTIRTQE